MKLTVDNISLSINIIGLYYFSFRLLLLVSHDYICGSSNLQLFLLTKSEVQYGSRQVILARAVGRHRWPGQPIVRSGAIGTVPRSIHIDHKIKSLVNNGAKEHHGLMDGNQNLFSVAR